MKYTIELPYSSREIIAFLRKEFDTYEGKQQRSAEAMIEYALISICNKHESGTRFKNYKAQIEKLGWTVSYQPGRYLWKIRKKESKLLFYPKTEKLWDSLNNVRLEGMSDVLLYLKNMVPNTVAIHTCSQCTYFNIRTSVCKQGHRPANMQGIYRRKCGEFKEKR